MFCPHYLMEWPVLNKPLCDVANSTTLRPGFEVAMAITHQLSILKYMTWGNCWVSEYYAIMNTKL